MWISVEDELPPWAVPVIIPGGVGYFNGQVWRTMMEPGDPLIQWEVIYWMPLPEPPKE